MPKFDLWLPTQPSIAYIAVNWPRIRLGIMNSLFKWTLIALAGSNLVSCKKGDAELPTHQALHEAILREDLSQLDGALKAGIDVNERFAAGHGMDSQAKTTLLHVACLAGDGRAVKALLDAGANPQLRDGYDRLPVELAIERKSKEVISILEDDQRKKASGETIGDLEIVGIVLRPRAEAHQKFRAVTTIGSNLDGDRIRELLVSMGLRITQAKDDPVMTITINRTTPTRVDYVVEMDAGFLNGGFDRGSFQKTHGYWVLTNVESGVR